MSRPHELGVCILCLDLTVHGGASAGPETLPRRLLEAGIPVTWGVGASQAALGQILLAVDAASEIALMA
ncbi:MAG: hypothetical protein ACREFZ_12005, partial [Acetobacteraceae bacterium]